MRVATTFLLPVLAHACLVSAASWTPVDLPIANTSSGRVRPLLSDDYPDVYQYLGVPFAYPPIGQLRFAPPQSVVYSDEVINATQAPPACYQKPSAENIFDIYEPGFEFFGQQSEDCLKLDLYRPRLPTNQTLPVLIFVYGGGFVQGAANKTYQLPTPWVQQKQDLIVVSIQYRLNIFGFPNSAALDSNNLGLQDIRAAVEWLRENVAAFGGDPDRLALWGQSAGSIAVNAWTYSYTDDPIVSGTISTSGSALSPREGWVSSDTQQSNFTFVAENLGCSGNITMQLDCMRQQPATKIHQFIEDYNATSPLEFHPVVDGALVFANYTERLLRGQVAKQPAIIGTSRREGERNIDHNLSPSGPNQTLALAYTAIAFLCSAELTTKLRHQAGVSTYRYEYKGNFSNISPLPWMGAYHAAILPLLFGTTNMQVAHPYSNQSTPFELAVGSHMQDLWRAFVNNPDQLQSMDWPLNMGGGVNQTTDAVKLFPGTEGQLSSMEYGARREEDCMEIDPYLISQTLPPQLAAELNSGSLDN